MPTPRVVVLTIAIAAAALTLGAARSSATAPPPGLPACEVAERPAPNSDYSEWDKTLLDPAFRLERGYEPPDLRVARIARQQVTLRDFVIGPLRSLLEAASREGAEVYITSSYRSFADQEQLVAGNPGSEDEVARAGHSEHQLGTAVDLGGDTEWLRLNASRFGFVLSYPAHRSPQWTCYREEPWHFRYFGPERAQLIEKSGLSPREWLWAEQAGTRSSARSRLGAGVLVGEAEQVVAHGAAHHRDGVRLADLQLEQALLGRIRVPVIRRLMTRALPVPAPARINPVRSARLVAVSRTARISGRCE